MKRIALNYIYLSKNHAGGKDQVGLNLLKGFYENGRTKNMYIFCYDYSVKTILKIAPNIQVIPIKSHDMRSELTRMLGICRTNTFVIPKLVRKYGIDLVYHLSCNTGLRRLKAVSIVLPHDIKAVSHRKLAALKIPLYKYLLYRVMYYIDFKNNDGIVAISKTDEMEIARYYPRFTSKLVQIYNPIDIQLPDSMDRESGNYILAVNLQFHHKNIITLIKAFELIKGSISENLVLVGNVPDRVQYLKDYTRQKQLEDRIIFTGFVDDEKKQELFRNCRLYVNPTLYEGFGMTAVEAVILGIPTLISDIKTNREVTKGLCQYYSPAEDEKALAAAILQCLQQEANPDIALQASRVLYEEYNYVAISQKYWKYFVSFLERDL